MYQTHVCMSARSHLVQLGLGQLVELGGLVELLHHLAHEALVLHLKGAPQSGSALLREVQAQLRQQRSLSAPCECTVRAKEQKSAMISQKGVHDSGYREIASKGAAEQNRTEQNRTEQNIAQQQMPSGLLGLVNSAALSEERRCQSGR